MQWLDGECQSLKSAKKYESHARALLPYIAGKTLTQAPAVAEDAKSAMASQGLSPATINRRIAILRHVANLAYSDWQWIEQPIGQRIRLLRENNERHVYLTFEQVEELAEACPNPAAGDMVRLAAFTGLRRGELFRLTSANLVRGCIILDANTKSGRPRTVPIPEHIVPIAERLPLPLSDPMLRKSWDKAREAVGMPEIRFHDLRHTYGSWLAQSGVPLRAIQELMGHSSLSMTQRYAHLGPEHLREAVTLMTSKVRVIK